MRTQKGDRYEQARKRSHFRNKPYCNLDLDLGLIASCAMRNKCPIFKPPSSGILFWKPEQSHTGAMLPEVRYNDILDSLGAYSIFNEY